MNITNKLLQLHNELLFIKADSLSELGLARNPYPGDQLYECALLCADHPSIIIVHLIIPIAYWFNII